MATTTSLENKLPEFKISLNMKAKTSELFVIKSSFDCAQVARKCFDADTIDWVESFIVLGLNRANKVVSFYKISQGGITGTVADPRVILQFAIMSNCTSIILSHNHPSGNLCPSQADEELTQKIKHAASYFDIRVLDHIIVSDEGYYSFADEGML